MLNPQIFINMLNILHDIPFSQCKWYRRIISDDAKYDESISQLQDFF